MNPTADNLQNKINNNKTKKYCRHQRQKCVYQFNIQWLFEECNSAENTKVLPFVKFVQPQTYAGHKPRGIHKGGGSHEQWTHHLSGLRQDMCDIKI